MMNMMNYKNLLNMMKIKLPKKLNLKLQINYNNFISIQKTKILNLILFALLTNSKVLAQ